MMKHSFALLVACVTTSLLAGCELYFGDGHDGDGEWNYCGSDGYYVCQGDNCEWQGPTCPAGVGGSGSGVTMPGGGSGYDCQSSTDCAAGCYCSNGTCEEAGFCTQDSDCGNGFVCNEMRSSCEPGTPACGADSECPGGQVCAEGACVATCSCASDAEATQNGFGYCDESRSTCMTGADPNGSCGGEPTCNQYPPSCPAGSVATIANGCWTGQCEAVSSCSEAPSCTHINDAQTCSAQAGCYQVVNGINCHITGTTTACQVGDANCTCDSYVFASCAAAN